MYFPKEDVTFTNGVLTSVPNKIYYIDRLLVRKKQTQTSPFQKATNTNYDWRASVSQLVNLWGLSTYINLHGCCAIVPLIPHILFKTTMCLGKWMKKEEFLAAKLTPFQNQNQNNPEESPIKSKTCLLTCLIFACVGKILLGGGKKEEVFLVWGDGVSGKLLRR